MVAPRPEPRPLTNIDFAHAVVHRARRARPGCHLGGVGSTYVEPLGSDLTDDDQAMTWPCGSVMVTMVLLKVL